MYKKNGRAEETRRWAGEVSERWSCLEREGGRQPGGMAYFLFGYHAPKKLNVKE